MISLSQNITSATSEFEILLRPHFNHLYSIAVRLSGGSVADGEDLIQELLLKLCSRQYQMEKIEKLRPWLVKVLYRLFIDYIRRENRSPLHLVIKPQMDETDPVDNLTCSSKGPEAQLAHRNRKDMLLNAVYNLNRKQQTVCILHDMEGYTLIELEEILDTPLGTLKSRLHRARTQLRQVLRLKGFSNNITGENL